jgi:EpsI family protein
LDRNLSLENLASVALMALMVAVGVLGWWLRFGPQLHLDVSPLESLPARIGSWDSKDIPMIAAVEQELLADFNLQRTYSDRFGQIVWLYVGYYGTERGGRPEHTPRGCYTGAGWGIESSRTVNVTPNGALRANEYLVAISDKRRLVHFWYRSHRRTSILGGLDQNVDRFLGRLFDKRADGALIRISTPVIGDDTVAARGRLLAFGSLVDPVVGEHWPTEVPCTQLGPEGCSAVPSGTGGAAASSEIGRYRAHAPSDVAMASPGTAR